MKWTPLALVAACLSTPAWAAGPEWSWIQVLSTSAGLQTEHGRAEVTINKKRLRISFFDEGSQTAHYSFRGPLAPPRDPPLFKTRSGFDFSGTLVTEASDYGPTRVRGTYLKDAYSGKDRSELDISCMETIVLGDGFNTITMNRVVDGHHAC